MSCKKVARVLVIIFSVLFVVIGSTISGLLAYSLITEPSFAKAIPLVVKYVCLGLHISLLLTGIIGLCAAFWTKKWLFSLFLPIVILTYASHLALAASLLINTTLVKDTIGEAIDSWQRGYQYNGNADSVFLMDEIHKRFQCCGSQTYKDYKSGTADTLQIPWSCCNAEKQGFTECQPKAYSLPFELAYDRGCRSVAAESSWEIIRIALYASVGLTALEFLTVVLSLSICCFCTGGGGVSSSGSGRPGRRIDGEARRYSALPLPDGYPPGGHETVL